MRGVYGGIQRKLLCRKSCGYRVTMRTLAALLLVATSALAQEPVIKSTLLLPTDTSKPMPVVLIIAGSGPTDRDGNTTVLPGKNNSLKMLAEGLAANGIASLRYDKRGVGESKAAATSESELRFDTYVDDAVAFCNQLKADKRFRRVVIAGHSEGSLIGMLAAKRCGASGFVSLSGTSRRAGDLLRGQLAGKLPPELAEKSEAILKSLEAGKTVADPPQELGAIYRASVQPYMISWMKYDPSKEIAALTMPVMIVQGSSDIQVPADDAKKLAAANPKAKLLIIDGMNHLLKQIGTDNEKQRASYTDPAFPLGEGLIPALVQFAK